MSLDVAPTHRTLADIVNDNPSTARVLERFGLDYCCGGKRLLEDACTSAGVSAAEVTEALGALEESAKAPWQSMGLGELTEHIEATHHAYLYEELPRLEALADKVFAVHGDRHPELARVAALVKTLRAELEPHMNKEDRVLFPMIRMLDSEGLAGAPQAAAISSPIHVMMLEHDQAGDLLEQLREATNGFQPPADGCTSYKMLYEGCAELMSDTHLHVHKENNVLFPGAIALVEQG